MKDTRVFVPKIMDVNGVTIQCLTMMQKDRLSLYVFLVGDGFFYQPYIYGSYDEYYLDSDNNVVDSREEADHIEVWYGNELFAQMYVSTDGELCIPIFDEETGEIVQKNIGRTAKRRDFRKYNIFENIIWALQNSEIDRDSVDMSAYTAPGIYMYLEDAFVIELVFQNDPKTVIIDGIIEYDIENKITKICCLPVFPHEALGNA